MKTCTIRPCVDCTTTAQLTRSTMEGLIAERPRQAEAIRRVFEQFGVH